MPDLTEQGNALVAWLTTHGLQLAVVAILLWLAYRWTRPTIHRVLVRVVHAEATTLGDDSVRRLEIDKRVETIEDLVSKVLRALVVFALVAVIFGIFDLWPIFAGLGLLLAAITLAGQDIVLDYLMGVLILVEGQYFKGDIIRVGAVEGTVEEVGLRRTVIRDPRGTLHSISNGLIRASANRTRSYAMAVVEIEGIADGDVERVISVLDAVGAAAVQDPALSKRLLDTPGYAATTRLSAYGATLRMTGRVQPEHRVAVEAELRRRVAAELAAAGVVPIRPAGGQAPPAATSRACHRVPEPVDRRPTAPSRLLASVGATPTHSRVHRGGVRRSRRSPEPGRGDHGARRRGAGPEGVGPGAAVGPGGRARTATARSRLPRPRRRRGRPPAPRRRGRRFRRARPIIVGGLTVELLASVAGLLVPSGPLFVATRLLGVAAASFVIPVSIALVATSYQGIARATAIGLAYGAYGAAGGAAPILLQLVPDQRAPGVHRGDRRLCHRDRPHAEPDPGDDPTLDPGAAVRGRNRDLGVRDHHPDGWRHVDRRRPGEPDPMGPGPRRASLVLGLARVHDRRRIQTRAGPVRIERRPVAVAIFIGIVLAVAADGPDDGSCPCTSIWSAATGRCWPPSPSARCSSRSSPQARSPGSCSRGSRPGRWSASVSWPSGLPTCCSG